MTKQNRPVAKFPSLNQHFIESVRKLQSTLQRVVRIVCTTLLCHPLDNKHTVHLSFYWWCNFHARTTSIGISASVWRMRFPGHQPFRSVRHRRPQGEEEALHGKECRTCGNAAAAVVHNTLKHIIRMLRAYQLGGRVVLPSQDVLKWKILQTSMNHPKNLTQDKTGEAAPTDDDAVCQERQLLPTERMLEKRANGDDFRCWPSYVYLDWNSFFSCCRCSSDWKSHQKWI